MLPTIAKTFGVAKFLSLKKDQIVCDTVEGLPFDFEADRYMGTWFGIDHSAHATRSPVETVCIQANYYDLNAEDGTFKVYNSSQASITDPRKGIIGDAKCPAEYDDG